MNVRTARARRTVAMAVAFVFVSTLAAYGLFVSRLYQDALTSARAVAAGHSRAIEDHLTLSMQAVDIVLKGIAAGSTTSGQPQAGSTLFGILRGAPHLRSVSLQDQTGKVIASSNANNVGVAVDTRSYFPPVAQSEQLRIGGAVQARDFAEGVGEVASRVKDGTKAGTKEGTNGYVPIVRTLTGNDGPVAVLVALNPDYFLNHFSQNLEATQGRVRVVRYDGLALFSNTSPDEAQDNWPALASRLETHEYGVFDHASGAGRKFITSYHASRLYPFAVMVQIDRERALREWREDTRLLAVALAAFLILVGAAGLFWYRRQVRFIEQDIASQRMRQLSASVFEASHDAIVLTDRDARIVATNGAYAKLNGYTAEEMLGKKPRLATSEDGSGEQYAAIWDAIRREGFWRGETVIRRKDGTCYDALLSMVAVLDADGKVQHYVCACSDISDRKKYEAELITARDRAEAGGRSKAAFLATMSHEIRTPMNGILGMLQLAQMAKPPEKIARYLGIAKSSADSLLVILNDILDFSRAESGSLKLERRPLDPARLINDIADLFAARIVEKGIELRRHLGEGLPARIEGDETRLRQILTNLLSNAIKFTDVGHVAIGLEVDDARQMLVFSIEDSGIGITPEAQKQIFAPFAQADDSITRKFGGTGLGLAICRQLADLMHGKLEVTSKPGEGSRFTFHLPLPASAPAALASGEADSQTQTA